MEELAEKQLWVLDQLYDDHYRLWEIGVEAAFPEFQPDVPNTEFGLLCSLVEQGYVGLYFGDLLKMAGGERVSPDGARTVLEQPINWDPPDKRRGYYLTLEPKGLLYYHGRGFGRQSP